MIIYWKLLFAFTTLTLFVSQNSFALSKSFIVILNENTVLFLINF